MVNLLNLANGEKVFKNDYQELSFFKIGAKGGFYLALVKKNNKYGVIDFHENIVVPFKYDKISTPNSYGQYLEVYIDNEKYFYDLFNRIELKSIEKEENVIETQLYKNLGEQAKALNIIGGLDGAATSYYKDSTIVFYDENLILEKDGKRGIYNLIQNKIVIPVDYDEIINNHYAKINECFFLRKGGLYTIISKFNLDPVTSEKFEEVKRLKSKFYFLGCNDGKCSLFDYSGKKLWFFDNFCKLLLKGENSKFEIFKISHVKSESFDGSK